MLTRARLRDLVRRIPGVRRLRRVIDRLRTPPGLRSEVFALEASIQRLERELGELREISVLADEDPGSFDEAVELRPCDRETEAPVKPRRILCSLGIGNYVQLLEVSSVTFRGYAARHGYDLLLSTRHIAPDRPPSWSKVSLVRRLLDDYDEVFWVDADAIFVDISKDIAELIRPGKDLYLVEHIWEGGLWRSANFGVFLIRSSDWSRRLLDDLWAAKRYINHRWWENAALLDMLGYELPTDLSRPRKVRRTALEERVEFIGMEWNSHTGGSSAPQPRIRHHGRRPLLDLRRNLLADLVTYRVNSRAAPPDDAG